MVLIQPKGNFLLTGFFIYDIMALRIGDGTHNKKQHSRKANQYKWDDTHRKNVIAVDERENEYEISLFRRTIMQKFHKIIISFTLALMLLSMVLIVTSCGAKHPIEKFKNKVSDAGSFEARITVSDIPLFGTITMKTKVDGNIQYIYESAFTDEGYIEIVGNAIYMYTRNDNGTWSKTKTRDTYNSIWEELFDPDDYEKVKGKKSTYKQKKDVTFDNFEDVVMTIDEDSCTIEMVSKDGGYDVKYVISKIGEIELTLPTVK